MMQFRLRFIRQWHAYKALYDQFFDVTMMLYTIVFVSAALFYFIRETIVEGHFGAFEAVPSSLLIVVLFIICMMFRPQSMTEDADRLFFIHAPSYVAMKRAAFYYSSCVHVLYIACATSIIAILLIPLHRWSWLMCMQLIVIGFALHYVSAYVSIVCQHPLFRRGMLLVVLLLVTVSATYMLMYTAIGSVAVIMMMLVLYERSVLRSNRYFSKLVTMQQKHRFRWQTRLFMISAQLRDAKPQWHTKKRPRTFTKSYANTANGALQELLLKSIWRNRTYQVNAFQMTGISIGALLLLPIWANYILALLLFVALLMFLEAVMMKLQQHPMFRIIVYTSEQWFYAYNNVKYRFALPFPVLYMIVTTMKWLL